MTIFFAIYGLGITIWLYSFFSVLLNSFEESNNKIVWILLLIFLPITAILYPFMGRKQLKQKVKDTTPIISKETVETGKTIKIKKKSKIIAVFLNIFAIGTGYLYVGNIKKALFLSILFPIFIFTQFYIATIYANIFTVILNYSLIVIIYIYLTFAPKTK